MSDQVTASEVDQDLRPVAIVTGAAGAIGRAICLRLGRDGYRIAALDILQDPLADLCRELKAAGIEARSFQVDLASPDQFQDCADRIIASMGRSDVLVNNAGALSLGPFTEIAVSEWKRIMDVNVRAVVFLTQQVARSMIDSGSGVVVNIGSVAGEFAMKDRAHYCASKAAVRTVTKGMAIELAPHGIRVAGINPKGIESGMSGNWLSASDGTTRIVATTWHDDPEQREQVLSTIPVGRPGAPADIANAVAFLAGPGASWVTGSMMNVDGGYLAGDTLTR